MNIYYLRFLGLFNTITGSRYGGLVVILGVDLPVGPVRVGIEAAVRQGWDRWLTGERGKHNKSAFIGMDSFGASAPAEELYVKFGITSDGVIKAVKDLL